VAGAVNGGGAEQGRRVLDEALRLIDVLQATRPAGAGDGAGHGGPECRYCPVCRGIAYLREADPEALDRLTGAVTEAAAAVRDLVAGLAGAAAAPAAAPSGADPDEVDVDPVEVERVEVQPVEVERVDRAG
jgi:hypothetical protein